jgi:hypothetical protein
MNALDPDQMSAAERVAEIAEILATGFVRMQRRKSSRLSRNDGDGSLDFLPDRSGHDKPRSTPTVRS